jgi:phosphoenolpyruvate carboxykinase (GTP)
MWPGFRDNSRIIKWMIDRIDRKTGAKETEIGLFPEENSIDLSGLAIRKDTLEELLKIDKESWKKELVMVEEFYARFGDKIPKKLRTYLLELKEKFGM